jgi:hypothetical protein
LTQDTDLPDELTHREFIAAYGTRADTDTIESFATVADAYEQAVLPTLSIPKPQLQPLNVLKPS